MQEDDDDDKIDWNTVGNIFFIILSIFSLIGGIIILKIEVRNMKASSKTATESLPQPQAMIYVEYAKPQWDELCGIENSVQLPLDQVVQMLVKDFKYVPATNDTVTKFTPGKLIK